MSIPSIIFLVVASIIAVGTGFLVPTIVNAIPHGIIPFQITEHREEILDYVDWDVFPFNFEWPDLDKSEDIELARYTSTELAELKRCVSVFNDKTSRRKETLADATEGEPFIGSWINNPIDYD